MLYAVCCDFVLERLASTAYAQPRTAYAQPQAALGRKRPKTKKKQKTKRGGRVLLDGLCTCTWALVYLFVSAPRAGSLLSTEPLPLPPTSCCCY